MLRVGLTGGIASGKSHVLRRLAGHGFHTLDLDRAARQVTAPGSAALAEIAAAFGGSVLGPDGALDRAALAARVFDDAEARMRLNAIVHPRVRAAESGWAQGLAQEPGAVRVTDAALLVEAGAHLRFDRIVVVWCDPAQQLARLRERDRLDERSARARLDAQLSTAEKRAFAHYEVDTSGTLADTDRATDALADELRSLARRPAASSEVPLAALLGGLVHGPQQGPRGLTPLGLLESAAELGGLELEALGRRLVPPARGPWYRAAQEAAPGAPASRLAVALAACCLRQGAPDPDYLASAAGSLARLTHVEPGSRADACLVALLALGRAVSGTVMEDPAAGAERLTPLAARFGGGPPSGRLAPVWSALRQFPEDPVAAGDDCTRRGGDGETAAALAGLGARFPNSPTARALRAALEQIRPDGS